MEAKLFEAFGLLVIGMVTVFVVLFLVVITGKLLIYFVHRFLSEETSPTGKNVISPRKVAALTAAVELITQGKGRVTHIEKE